MSIAMQREVIRNQTGVERKHYFGVATRLLMEQLRAVSSRGNKPCLDVRDDEQVGIVTEIIHHAVHLCRLTDSRVVVAGDAQEFSALLARCAEMIMVLYQSLSSLSWRATNLLLNLSNYLTRTSLDKFELKKDLDYVCALDVSALVRLEMGLVEDGIACFGEASNLRRRMGI